MAWFTSDLYTFLDDLAAHNERDWFQAHKSDYERHIKRPALDFIAAVAPRMAALAPEIRCDDKALFRIHRDTRFSKDKSPYKTHVGLHFRHLSAGDVHTPGYYLQLSNPHSPDGGCFFGCGIWMPDPPTLQRLRQRIVDDPEGWSGVVAQLPATLRWDEEALQRPPRGFPKDHPHDAFLRKKSMVLMCEVSPALTLSDDLVEAFMGWCEGGAPLMADLCRTLALRW